MSPFVVPPAVEIFSGELELDENGFILIREDRNDELDDEESKLDRLPLC